MYGADGQVPLTNHTFVISLVLARAGGSRNFVFQKQTANAARRAAMTDDEAARAEAEDEDED